MAERGIVLGANAVVKVEKEAGVVSPESVKIIAAPVGTTYTCVSLKTESSTNPRSVNHFSTTFHEREGKKGDMTRYRWPCSRCSMTCRKMAKLGQA